MGFHEVNDLIRFNKIIRNYLNYIIIRHRIILTNILEMRPILSKNSKNSSNNYMSLYKIVQVKYQKNKKKYTPHHAR